MSDVKLKAVHSVLANIRKSLEQVEAMVKDIETGKTELTDDDLNQLEMNPMSTGIEGDRGRIIEGVFDGYQMIGPDGTKYSVPANYSSKSKLVEGDLLKLTIAPDGSFIYKQIRPIDRERMMGKLVRDKETGEYRVLVDKRLFKVLLASVTYYQGEISDQVVILVPKGGMSSWAAIDNIIKAAAV
ncbi:MAG: hypothetical protein HY461_03005 [Parcubacteria group bacterium]|nr:hypothetical protein [Parcubacteria group bacterium]